MDDKYRSFLIGKLKQELTDASNISTKTIASKIEEIGFTCLVCGKCCRFAFGDNRVLLTPHEMRVIKDHTGTAMHNVATPATFDNLKNPEFTDLIDTGGSIHTFGWMLARKSNGDCNFIKDAYVSNRCRVYDVRPMLCRTYPFYMQDMELHISECEGLGHEISSGDSLKIAVDVIDRYVIEIGDTIALYEKFEDIVVIPECVEITTRCTDVEKYVVYVVHDSEGAHKFIVEFDDGTNFID
ncbi:MAG: YkgJ family cysteine cluster protein [Methanosarcinaceae archaeon]